MGLSNNLRGCLKVVYLILAFCSALFLGALKGFLVGPIACLILTIGNIGVILGLLPAHLVWTIYTLVKIRILVAPLKVAILLALPALLGIWLGLSIAGSVLVGVGYGFFTPWISTFEAFRHEKETKKFLHSVVDGTWGTIKGSCTVVRDFADLCYHSYLLYLKELRESPDSTEVQTLRLIHVPACIIVGLMGLIVEIPLYTSIAIVKSPYMLFKGWFRLVHDLISREGPFLETACVPIAGLTILVWPIVVVGSILLAIFSSFFVGLYASIIVFQNSMNTLMIGSISAKELFFRTRPQYRKRRLTTRSSESAFGGSGVAGVKPSSASTEAPAMFVSSLAPSRSVKETIQEVKIVQIWGNMMRTCEIRGKELLDANLITPADLCEWLKERNGNEAPTIVGVGLPCYSLLQTMLYSIKGNSSGMLLLDDVEITNLNRPKDKLLDWFFNPLMVLKEQIKALMLEETEVRFLEKIVLFGSNKQRMEAWENGSLVPQNATRAAQIQGISRRMTGMVRSISKFPTYRRMYREVVKDLVAYSSEKEASTGSSSKRSIASIENV